MKLYKVEFMRGHREAFTQARSIREAEAKVAKAIRDSAYTKEERKIMSVSVVADQSWPGVFGG